MGTDSWNRHGIAYAVQDREAVENELANSGCHVDSNVAKATILSKM